MKILTWICSLHLCFVSTVRMRKLSVWDGGGGGAGGTLRPPPPPHLAKKSNSGNIQANSGKTFFSATFGKIWIIQSRAMIFEVLINLCMPPSKVALCYNNFGDFTTVQLSYGTCTKIHKLLTFHANIYSLYLCTSVRYVGLRWLCLHLWLKLDQPDYWYRRQNKYWENLCPHLCTKSMESCSLMGITDSGRVRQSERVTYNYTKPCITSSLKWIIQICSNNCWVF